MGIITFNKHEVSFKLAEKLLLQTSLPVIFTKERFDFQSVTFIFCNDEFLLNLNREYLKHDTYTDILTFTLSETSLPIISEIYISIDRVKENAETLREDFQTELRRVMIHGILHLCGYSDHTQELKAEMHERENFYLKELFHVKQ